MRVLVTGSCGQLGSKVVETLREDARLEVRGTSRAELDITKGDEVQRVVKAFRPTWIVNCAAYTEVEKAESEPERAYLLNSTAVRHLADAGRENGSRLLHLSTDYVFSGLFPASAPRPYHEEDAAGPLSVYGASKLAGEICLQNHPVRATILRTSWLYGGPGRNFLHTMLRLGKERSLAREPLRVVDDQRGTPTDAWSLAAQVRRLLFEEVGGVLHASSEGETSWFGFAEEIFRIAEVSVRLEPITSAQYPARARRPAYSVLENRRLNGLAMGVLPDWKVGLRKAWERLAAP